MLEKIERKLRNRMEKWTTEKLIICKTCSWIIIILRILIPYFNFTLRQIPGANEVIPTMSTIGYVLWTISGFLLVFLLCKMILIINSVLSEIEPEEEEETDEFAGLANMLSRRIPKEVRYSPFSIDEKCNAELEECIKLLSADNVTHYAILKDSYVEIISRNNRGEKIGERKVDAITFCRNYKLLELSNLSNDS